MSKKYQLRQNTNPTICVECLYCNNTLHTLTVNCFVDTFFLYRGVRCCCHSLLLYGKAIVFTCSKPIDASDWFNTQASSSGSTMFAFAGDFTVCSLVSYSLGFSGFSHSLHIPCTLPRLLCLQNNDLICPGKSIQSLKSSNWATKQTPRSASNGYSNFPQYLFLFFFLCADKSESQLMRVTDLPH